MVMDSRYTTCGRYALSVLALSSRFDGPMTAVACPCTKILSVLALSSRFDGPGILSGRSLLRFFQYSLCRVVLMVLMGAVASGAEGIFQYSLCRVVLMVVAFLVAIRAGRSFSTRSVESF